MALDTIASRTKRRKLPVVDPPRVDDDQLRRSLEAIREHLRMYEGDSGAPKERFVTIEELEKAGLIGTKLQNNFALIDSILGGDVAQGQQAGGGSGGTVIINEGDTVTGATTLAGLSDTNVAGAATNSFLQYVGGQWIGRRLFSVENTWTALNTFQNKIRIRGIDSGYVDFEHDNTDLIATGSVTGALELSNFDLRFGNAQGVLWYNVAGTPTELLAFESAGSATTPDPNIASVVALFNAENATAGATTVAANIGNSTLQKISSGVAEVSTEQAKFGTRSLKTQYTSGINFGIWEETAKNADLELGSSDFTLEFWVYATQLSGSQFIRYDDSLTGSQRAWYLVFTLSGNLQFFTSTTGGSHVQTLSVIQGVSLGSWHHIAVTRQGSTMRLFFNGALINSGTFSGTFYSGANQRLRFTNSSGLSTWWIDEFRLTKGVARYTGAFTPPTEPADDGSFIEFMTVGDPVYPTQIDGTTTTITGNAQVDGTFDATGAGVFASTLAAAGVHLFEPLQATLGNFILNTDQSVTVTEDNYALVFDFSGGQISLEQLDHTVHLSNIGTNTHAQIDTHIADATIHFTEASIDHANIQSIGTNTHAQIDTHIADTTIHFTTLDGLSDVAVATPADRHVLVYDGVTDNRWENRLLVEADISDLQSYALASHTHSLTDVTDVTATAAELNLLDLAGLTVGWALIADSATTASWQAIPAGGTIGGSITDNQIAVGAATADSIEGTAGFTYDGTTLLISNTAPTIVLYESDQGVNLKHWEIEVSASAFRIQAATDAASTGNPLIQSSRASNNPNIVNCYADARWEWYGGTEMWLRDRGQFYILPSGDNGWITFGWDGSDIDFNITAAGSLIATDLNVSGFSGDFVMGNYRFNMNQSLAGADNYVLTYDSVGGKISLEAATASGNVSSTGTPANNQLAIWTDASTIEGDPALTFDSTTNTLSMYDTLDTSFVTMKHTGTTFEFDLDGATDDFIFRTAGASRFQILGNSTIELQLNTNVAGKLGLPASTTSAANLILPHGVAPTTPVDGDVWTTTAGMYVRINGSTVGPLGSGGSQTPWTSDIDAATYDLTIGNMFFDNSGNSFRLSNGTDMLTMQQQTDITQFSFTGVNTFQLSNLAAGMIIQDGAYLRINDSLDTDYGQFSHDGIDFNTTFFQTTAWNIDGPVQIGSTSHGVNQRTLTVYDDASAGVVAAFESNSASYSLVDIDNTNAAPTNGAQLRFLQAGAVKATFGFQPAYSATAHLGVMSSHTASPAHVFYVDGTGYYMRGGSFRQYDAGLTDYAEFSHDGVDYNTTFAGTTEWNIGVGLNVTGGVTATSFSGSGASLTSLTAANISAGSLASGVNQYFTASAGNFAYKIPFMNYTGTASTNAGLLHDSTASLTYNPSTDTLVAGVFSGSGASLTSIPETAITDGSVLARVAENETITGDWTWTTYAPAMRFGLVGDYDGTSGSASWGATIWSLDSAYKGGTAGTDSSSTSVYGLRWLRSNHAGATTAIQEGVYVFSNGSIVGGIGLGGMQSNGSIHIEEQASADVDIATFGQLWVLNQTPNYLMFTDDAGTDKYVGMGQYTLIANQTFDMNNAGNAEKCPNGAWYSDNATTYTLTLENSTGTDFPVGSQMTIWNEGSGTLTINEGTATTLYLLTGSAVTDTAGGCTMAQGGYATLIRKSTTVYLIMGAGLTA